MSKSTHRRSPVEAGSRRRRAPVPQPRSRIPALAILGSVVVAFAVVVLAVALVTGRPGSGPTARLLPGAQAGAPPWPPELSHLSARLAADGLPALTAEGSAQHTHEHLDLVVDGVPVVVPPDVGIDQVGGVLSPIHTHDSTGIIHVESPTLGTFTLGQFFDVWGLRFDSQCVGGTCVGSGRTLSVYVNGRAVTGDPRQVVLAAHEEIVVAVGTPTQLPGPIPASYPFPAGL
jgi:hypothetical protein